jgi:hypothetical protein
MKLENLIDRIAPRWQGEFVQFIHTGEASDDFLQYLDSDPASQQAVEEAFAAQSAAFQEFAKLLQSPEELAASVAAPSSADLAHDISASLRQAAELSGYDQHQVVEAVGRSIREELTGAKRQKAAELVGDLSRMVGKVAG